MANQCKLWKSGTLSLFSHQRSANLSHNVIPVSVQFSHSVMSDSLRPHESHHARPPCPSPTPRVYSNSCPLTSDAIQPSHPLSSPSPPALNPSQHQGLFQWVNSSHEVAKVLEFQLQHQSFQWTPSIHPPKWLKWNKTKWNKTGKTNVDRM